MSAVEKLFVQIFEKKKAIIDQVKRQTDLIDQNLASKLLIDGIAPPPWLWDPPLHAHTSDLGELKKEQLISGLLFPLPQPAVPYSNSFCSLYSRPVAIADYGVVPGSSLVEGIASKKDIESQDWQPVLSTHPTTIDGCASSGFPELEGCVTSPECQRDARTSGIYQEASQSLVKIQRSKSRQRALEIRNSTKSAKSRLCMDSNTGVETTCSAIASLRPDCAIGVKSAKPVEINIESCASEEVKVGNELESVKPVQINNQTCAIEKVKVGDELELVKSVHINNNCRALEEVKVGNSLSKERDSNIYSGRLTRSRSSQQKSSSITEFLKLSSTSFKAKEDGGSKADSISAQQSIHANVLLESTNSSEIADQNFEVEAKIGLHESKEKQSNGYHGRITRSRISRQQSGCANKPSVLVSPCDVAKVDGGICAQFVGELAQPSHLLSGIEAYSNLQSVQGSQVSAWRSLVSEKGSGIRESKESSNEDFVPRNTRLQARSATSEKNKSAQAAQVHEARSLPNHEDLDLSTGNAEQLDKQLVDCAGGYSSSDTAAGIKGKTTDCNTSDCSAPLSISTLDVPLHEKAIHSSGVDLPIVSGSQVSILLCDNTSDIVHMDNCAAMVPETEIPLDMPIGAPSVRSGSTLDSVDLRVGLEEVQVSRSPSDITFMKPKLLDFDNLEDYNLNEPLSQALENKLRGGSTEDRPVDLSCPANLLNKVTPVNCQAECNSSQVTLLLEDHVNLCHEEEACRGPSEAHDRETAETSKTFDLMSGSSVKERFMAYEDEVSGPCEAHDRETAETSNTFDLMPGSSVKERSTAYEDSVSDTLLANDKITEQECSMVDHSTAFLNVASESYPVCLSKPADFSLSNMNVDKKIDLSSEKTNEELDAAKIAESVSDDGKLDIDTCGDLQIPTCVFGEANVSGVLRNPDLTIPNFALEFPIAAKVDETNGNSVLLNLSSDISQYQNVDSYLMGRCFSDDKNVGTSKLSEYKIAEKHIQQQRSLSFGMEGSWPQHKRRKIDGQLTSARSVSPCLRVMPPQSIQGNLIVDNCNSVEDYFKALHKFQHVPISCIEDVGQPIVNKSPAGELHHNAQLHMEEVFEAPHELQVEEEELSLGERVSSTVIPSTSIHDQLLLPKWTKLGTADCKGTENVKVVGSTTDIFDTRELCTLEDEKSFHYNSILDLKDAENFTSAAMASEQRKYHLEGNVKFSGCSVGSPRNQSMNLIDADATMPVLEGFIMPTDSGKSCVSEDVIHLEKMDLPDLECAGLLEQLCRSASKSTPSCHFPTTFKFLDTPKLNHSVPNGLLECMDLQSTLSICDDTSVQSDAGYRSLMEECKQSKSYSDCLPFSPAYSAWDVKKPFTSPVGKLWDSITSYSSSSEKQWSLNPELPCINEENEDTEEVADKCQEDIMSDMMPTSAKREPLADVTQDPNLAASVSEAEVFVPRGSMDSISTEICFTGTHKGKQNSSKRRYTNKAKENQRQSIRESLRNRFSKPKLSGKSSIREGPSLSGMDCKRNNIVSNITSFVPLVQQKQAAAVCTGKRDVKVRALEAAEAAKRLAEKKENERKMKKEALKLERARLEQENIKQLVIQKKREEEERKQKVANLAAKKRQKEEEERKEKEKKRKRVEEAWKKQRGSEKLAGKEVKKIKFQAPDERSHEKKKTNGEVAKHRKVEEERGNHNLEKLLKDDAWAKASSSDAIKPCISHEGSAKSSVCGDNTKVKSTSPERSNLVTEPSQQQSYDMSPYKCSDDEDEEDERPKTKFIPSWSSKKILELAVSSQQSVDPTLIFPLDTFCIDEVVMPRVK